MPQILAWGLLVQATLLDSHLQTISTTQIARFQTTGQLSNAANNISGSKNQPACQVHTNWLGMC